MRAFAAWGLVLSLTFLTFAAFAQQAECIPPALLNATQEQRNRAQNETAAIVAQANAEIARLTKELEAAKKAETKK